MKTSIDKLRLVGILEGVSFLVLLGIAMPLKYFAGMPMAVKIAGWIHGVLFIAFCVYLAKVRREHAWSNQRTGVALLAALLPFGTFVLDARLRRELESSGPK